MTARSAASGGWRKTVSMPAFQAVVAGLLALSLYAPAFPGTFILDDWTYLVNNPLIRDFTYFQHLGNLKQYLITHGVVLSTVDIAYNFVLRPVSYLTFALNYHLHGLEPAGYLVVNILLHIAATMLAYLFVFQLVRQLGLHGDGEEEPVSPVPFLVALLFASHPVLTQGVSYLVQRFTSIAACWYLLALSAYLVGRGSRTGISATVWYLVALAATVGGMLSKENCLTLPVMITVVETVCFRESLRRRLLLLLPFLATLAIIPLAVITLTGQTASLDANVQLVNFRKIPHLDYLFTEFRVILTYLRLLVIPVQQQLDYDYPIYHSFFSLPVAGSLLALLALASLGVHLMYRGRIKGKADLRLVGFGIVWFFVTLSVESGLVPMDDVAFEHRLYLPSVGLFVTISSLGHWYYNLLRPQLRSMALAGAVGVLLLLCLLTVKRNILWRDAVAMWEDNAAKAPGKARVLQCLGDSYLFSAKPRQAIAAYERIPLRIGVEYQKIYHNLGEAYIDAGDFPKGVRMFEQAIACDPSDYLTHRNLAMKYAIRGTFDQALNLFATAIRLNPHDLLSRRSRAEIFTQLGRYPEAMREYQGLLGEFPMDMHAVQELKKLQHRPNL